MKYSIQIKNKEGFNAGSKAVNDTICILTEIGYKPIFISYPYIRLIRYIVSAFSMLIFYFKIKKNDICLIQWPLYSRYSSVIYKAILNKKARLQLLIHDINSLRQLKDDNYENDYFNLAELIIVHSETMKEYLINKNISSTKIQILTSFDYLTNDKLIDRNFSKTIVYAGNLNKSAFLKKINSNILKDVNLNCYGIKEQELPSCLIYKGSFSSENVSILEGSWGLVWDGESIDKCSGSYGEYLKYNAPHKLSLYIVTGLPVIIWKEQALAKYIENNGLGITINSLKEIPNKLSTITEKEYNVMKENVTKEAIALRNGEHLKAILNTKIVLGT